jgi:DNA-binding MarR family transcriptional regulator
VSRRQPDAERLAVWRAFLDAHANITNMLEHELQAERDLPLAWYEVLFHLSEAGGRLRMAELSERLVVNKSSLSRMCDRLESAGLVRRDAVPEDARGIYAVLTKQGREVLRRAGPTHLRGVYDHFASYLTDTDVTALQRVFAKLPSAAST